MRRIMLGIAALLISTQALGQGGPPGGGGGGGPPGGGGGPPGGGPPGGGSRPKAMKPLKRKKLDKPVEAMFRVADTNHDGLVTLDEVRAIVTARRDAIIRARFEKVDSDHSGSIDADEFLAWQREMGSAARLEKQSVADRGGPIPETIEPELGNGEGDMLLAQVIEPISAMTIVNANSNYDGGVSLEELLAYERKRFDAADADGDGELSMEEVRSLNPRGEGQGRGPGGPGAPGGSGRPGDGPPGCPPGANC